MLSSNKRKAGLLLVVATGATIAVFVLPRIAQDPAYHSFADSRSFLGVANFINVVTNAAFPLAGAYGLSRLPRTQGCPLRAAYVLLCIGVILVGFGSACYHLAPSNSTLTWDRAPMTIAFMALFTLVVGDYVSGRAGSWLLWPSILVGLASVVYWQFSESRGIGDLRPYALVQFLPMLLMPLILILFRPTRLRAALLWSALIVYALSKVAEYFDTPIFELTGFISGHSVKHLLAAAAVLAAIMAFRAGAPMPSAAAEKA
ncbi:MAG: ceramidase domain-containing protein [Gammaproteobacteria bacterium]